MGCQGFRPWFCAASLGGGFCGLILDLTSQVLLGPSASLLPETREFLGRGRFLSSHSRLQSFGQKILARWLLQGKSL